YLLHVSVGGNNSSFDTATELGNLGTAGQTVTDVAIEPEVDVILPPEPGGNDEPGHRDIPVTDDNPQGSGGENHLSNANQGQFNAGPNNGRGTDPFAPDGIRTIAYNFQSLYGQDPTGGDLFNTITEEQKQRVREVFELFAMVSGIQFVEAASVAEAQAMGAQFDDILTIATGDLRALVPSVPTGVGGVEGLSGIETNVGVGYLAIIDGGENFTPAQNQYGGKYFRIAMNEIGRLLGLNHALDLEAVLGSGADGALGIEPTNALSVEPVFPGDHDIVHLRRLYGRDSIDIDMYKFNVNEAGTVTIETIAERLQQASQLDTVLTLYREVQTVNGPVREIVARNDNYYGTDSLISLRLDPGTYYVGVSSVGNENYDPVVRDSGSNGVSDGAYELRLDIQPDATSAIVDVDDSLQADGSVRPATPIDGDGDGKPGGIFDYAFQVGETIIVDKSGVNAGCTPDGSLDNPYTEIYLALSEAETR
ncbi:MAG: pre-peptidase C-terminal domain-containing protein, partial [Planctomycetaceae bacterium]|nr:pre-peptidase C-terminal domain-containing protein [Planctomycetaceae bacterium]